MLGQDISGRVQPHWARRSWRPRQKYTHLGGIYSACRQQPQTASVPLGEALKFDSHNYSWHQTEVSDPPQRKHTTDCNHSGDGLWSTSLSATSIVAGRTSGTALHIVTARHGAFTPAHPSYYFVGQSSRDQLKAPSSTTDEHLKGISS